MTTDIHGDCARCGHRASVSTPEGRLCGGHAMVESARRWNLGDWNWSVEVAGDDEAEGAALSVLLDSGRAADRLLPSRFQ